LTELPRGQDRGHDPDHARSYIIGLLGDSDLFGVGVDSQKNEVSKSEKDAETSYHSRARVSSKAEQSSVR